MAEQDARSTLEALASLPEFYHPRVSPDGDRIAYYYDETGRNELYVRDLASGETRKVSDGEVPRSARYPIGWSRDGDRIYFHRDDGGDEQNDIYAMDLDGSVEQLVATDGQCVLQDVGPGGRYLLYASTESGQMNLHRHDLETGENEQLTDYDRPVRGGDFSPDGDRIAYATNESEDLENRDAYVASVDPRPMDGDGDARKLDVGEEGAETTPVDWSPDGSAVLLGDNSPDLARVGVYDLASDDVTWHGDGEHEEHPSSFLPDGEGVIARRMRDAGTVPVRYAPDGTGEELDLDDGVADFPGDDPFLADGDVVCTYTTAARRKELHRYDPDAGEREVLVEADYGRFDPGEFADCEVITYESTDGTEIEGLLYDSGERPSAGIVQVHGGPHGRSSKRFSYRTQFLVQRGYTVFQPNYRGSIGRGREFKNAVHGDWGGMEQADVAEAGRWLKARDWIDEDRVAVLGGSYGGYSTYMQLVQYPDLWTTGAAWVGMTDLLALFEESMPHFKTTLREQLGDPEANADFYRERSAITHVEDIQRPILMVHGVNDPRCPISQARRFREALEEEKGWVEGEDFVYEELGEEGHGSTDIDQKIRALRIMADYLDDWL